MSRITVYSKDGDFIGDIRAATVRSYTLASSGVIGQCKWTMSLRDLNTSLKYLEYGKYIIVRDGIFPAWAGVIYTPRSWGIGTVTINAYQLEKILEWRTTAVEEVTGTGGALFTSILSKTNLARFNEKMIQPDKIYEGGNSITEALGNHAYAHCQSIAEKTGFDFDVVANFNNNGQIYLTGNWYERKGIDTQRTFQEGYNIGLSENIYEEQGELYNDVTGYSDASTAGSRISSNSFNEDAINKYGLYQTANVYTGVTQQSALDSSVMSDLKKTIEPSRVVDVVPLNFGDTYQFIDIGNIFNIKLGRAGFENDGFGLHTQVRIMGMEIDDLKFAPSLVVEVVT